jgi:prepilin-type N-terminal cleavage/methylation domain-containing protein
MNKPAENKGVRYIYRRAFTLTEMLVAISVVAIITAVTIPAIYAVREGWNSSGADTLISAALSSAKAIAAKEQKYAGVRFQCVPDPERPGEPGDQYIIFIIQDPSLSAYGFRAANGVAPMKLPVNQGVMDLMVKVDYTVPTPVDKPGGIGGDIDIATPDQLRDTTTFSIVFSPSGRLVTHEVKVWNKDGEAAGISKSPDMVFNTKVNVDLALKSNPVLPPFTTGRGMFYQDDDDSVNGWPGLCREPSRMSLVIYDKRELKKQQAATRWSGYLEKLAASQQLYINPYTGTIIENQNRRNATK